MKDIRIKTGEGLQNFIQRIYEAGLKSSLHSRALQEKEKQAAVTPQEPEENSDEAEGDSSGLFDDDDSGSDVGSDSESSKTVADDSEKMKNGEVGVDDVVDRLNIIRSGRSLKDDGVHGAMSQYVESLSSEERTALLAFLKGISQIVTGEIEGDAATEPSSDPASIAMQKKNAEKSKSVKPNVIKGPSGGDKKKPGIEDTAGPTPITPKKRG